MAIRKVDGYEVLGFETIEEAVQELFNIDLAVANQAIRMLSEGIGAKHEAVPDLLLDKPRRAAHQKAYTAIAQQLTTRYSGQKFSKSKVARLIAAANPWFNLNLAPKLDGRLDEAAAKLSAQQAQGPEAAAKHSARVAADRATEADAFRADDVDIPDEATSEEVRAFTDENQARLVRGEKSLTFAAWRRARQ